MVELKTINNIPVYILSPENCSILSDEDGDFERITVSKSELKQEAMKWIKNEEGQTTDSIDSWIKHFFNITEEDLE